MNKVIKQFLVEAEQLKHRCRKNNIRSMLILSGELTWCEHIATLLFLRLNDSASSSGTSANTSALEFVQWVSNDLPMQVLGSRFVRHVHRSKASSLLGNDTENIVINCFDGFNPNLLASVSGTLKGSGFIVLLVPSLPSWPSFKDPDYQRYAMTRPASLCADEKPKGYFLRRFIHAVEMQQAADAKPKLEITVFDQQKSSHVISTELKESIEFKKSISDSSNFNCNDSAVTTLSAVKVITSAEQYSMSTNTIQPTPDQLLLIGQVYKLLKKPKGVLVVKADRGRGKSTALGIAVAELIKNQNASVIVTSPQRSHVNHFFSGLQRAGQEQAKDNTSIVRYLPPDKLIGFLYKKVEADVVIVDEAAALALPLLYKLTEHFPRVIFATTALGYEGSGRGFYLRFFQHLHKITPYLDECVLSTPCRWSENCGLEAFVDRVLCLKPEVPMSGYSRKVLAEDSDDKKLSKQSIEPNISLRKISKSELLTSEPLLQSVFALLVQAHYQTQPNDLRLLLDQPYSHLWVAEKILENKLNGESANVNNTSENVTNSIRCSLVAVLFVVEEGGFESSQMSLANAIVKGVRRPKGNLVAQKLACQSGNAAWCALKGMRVVRIAVSEVFRLQGIASLLLNHLTDHCLKQGIDYWSSSFAYDLDTADFWAANNVLPVHLGMHLDKASAARNLMVIKPLTHSATALAIKESSILRENIPLLSSRFILEFDEPAIGSLLLWLSNSLSFFQQQRLEWHGTAAVEQHDVRQLMRYIQHELPVASIYPALSRWVSSARSDSGEGVSASSLYCLNDEQQQFLQLFLRRAPDWESIAKASGLTGRKQVLGQLVAVIRCLFD